MASAALEDQAGFFGLLPGADRRHWRLRIAPWRTVGEPAAPFLFGGIGLGASIKAAELATGRATIWATAQYLSHAPLGALLDIEANILVEGRHTTQARATARVEGREVLGAALSLSAGRAGTHRQWPMPPQMPPPQDCPPLPIRWACAPDDMYSRIDTRVAGGWDARPPGATGHILLWMRPRLGDPIDRPMLALMGDFLPASIGNALAEGQGDVIANSLDNSIRFLGPTETEWVLCDIRVEGAADGFGHGRMHLFAGDGTLMASAGQSVILRGARHPR